MLALIGTPQGPKMKVAKPKQEVLKLILGQPLPNKGLYWKSFPLTLGFCFCPSSLLLHALSVFLLLFPCFCCSFVVAYQQERVGITLIPIVGTDFLVVARSFLVMSVMIRRATMKTRSVTQMHELSFAFLSPSALIAVNFVFVLRNCLSFRSFSGQLGSYADSALMSSQ